MSKLKTFKECCIIYVLFMALPIIFFLEISPSNEERSMLIIEKYCEENAPENYEWVGNNFGCYKSGFCRYVTDNNELCYIAWECRDGVSSNVWENEIPGLTDWDYYSYENMEKCKEVIK